MEEKIKTKVDRLLLVLATKKKIPTNFAKIEFFFNFENKSCLSMPVYIMSKFVDLFKINKIFP